MLAAHPADQDVLDQAANDFLDTVDGTLNFEEGLKERSALPDNPSASDVDSFDHPGRDPDDLMGIVVGRISEHPIESHWPIQLWEDQRPVEPYSPDLFSREFLSGGDCWLDNCDTMETINDIIKENLLMTMAYKTRKDFRTFNEGEGYIAWSWTQEEIWDEGENDAILQSFTVDIWAPRGNRTMRVGALWSETVLSVNASEDLQLTTTMVGLDKTQGAADEYLDDVEGDQ